MATVSQHAKMALLAATASRARMKVRPQNLKSSCSTFRLSTAATRRHFPSTIRSSSSIQSPTAPSNINVHHSTAASPATAESTSVPSAPSSTSSQDATDPLPWYLQVNASPPPPPHTSTFPSSTRDLLPSLPSDPPPILSPILSYLSTDAGLDDLDLLDLRDLSPPSALGANLLMILGTARSVKHLNVTAGRFCRWLRTQYRLRPHGDGLLGRRELKLKLRRKARRAKLAAGVGNEGGSFASSGLGADDGIITDWICVNVGLVDNAAVVDGQGVVGDSEQTTDENTSSMSTSDVPIEQQILGQKNSPETATTEKFITEAKDGKEISSTTFINERRNTEIEDSAESEEPDHSHLDSNTTTTTTNDNKNEDDDGDQDDKYIGFGSRSTNPRIVVQIFTEEKRAEMDLEGLWQARATKRYRRDQKGNAEAKNGD